VNFLLSIFNIKSRKKLNNMEFIFNFCKRRQFMFQLTVRQKIAALVLLFFLAVGGVLIFINGSRGNAREFRDDPATGSIYVYVCGAVQKPGVISVKPATRKFEVLKLAGGTLPEADLNRVNLAEYVEDGEQLYVPKVGEVIEPPSRKRTTHSSTGKQSAKTSQKQTAATSEPKPKGPFDLNTATEKQLESVSGIGPVMAAKILQYRADHGNFQSYEELEKVPGIGPSKLEKFRPNFYVK
jgi:competence protein ComEA